MRLWTKGRVTATSMLCMRAALAVMVATVVAVAGWGAMSSVAATATAAGGVRVLAGARYRFAMPSALALSGSDLFVANERGGYDGQGSVTEVNTTTGAVVRVMARPADHFDQPNALAVSGSDLFAANPVGGYGDQGSITELDAATGVVIRVIGSRADRLDTPDALLASGARLFVANQDANSVTELNASTGALIHVIAGRTHELRLPGSSLALNAGHLFVGNDAGVTELNATTGALIRVITGPASAFFPLRDPQALLASGRHVFVLNASPEKATGVEVDVVTVLNAVTGAVLRMIPDEGFIRPVALAVSGPDLFVVDSTSGGPTSIVELSATTGAFVRRFQGPPYRFAQPGPIVTVGDQVVVANTTGNSLTEFTPSSSLPSQAAPNWPIREIGGSGYRFSMPDALAVGEAHLFVANPQGGY